MENVKEAKRDSFATLGMTEIRMAHPAPLAGFRQLRKELLLGWADTAQ